MKNINYNIKKIGKKILHFEDDRFLGGMYKSAFEREGFEVKHFINPPKLGEDLIELVLREKPDFIIMDVIMPEIDGFTATIILKSDQRTKDIPIFGLDNLSQGEDIKKAIESGMTDYWIKARYTPSQIVNNIKDFLAAPKKYQPKCKKYLKSTHF